MTHRWLRRPSSPSSSPSGPKAQASSLPSSKRSLRVAALYSLSGFYGHAREQGWTLFFREVPYVSEFPDFLGCLRSAFEYIGDEAMISLVSDVEHVHRAHDQVMKDIPTLDPREPRYAAVIEALAPLDRRYRALVAGSLGRVAALVRGRARDFVAFQVRVPPAERSRDSFDSAHSCLVPRLCVTLGVAPSATRSSARSFSPGSWSVRRTASSPQWRTRRCWRGACACSPGEAR